MPAPVNRFGPWGFSRPFGGPGWGPGGEPGTTTTSTPPSTPTPTQTQTQTQIQTQTQVQTSVITSVTDITSVASATVVTTVVGGPAPSSPTGPASSGTDTPSSHSTARSGSEPVSSAADHASSTSGPATGSSSVVYLTLSLSGSTVTLLSTAGPSSRPSGVANANGNAGAGGHHGMSGGEIAALVVACVCVFVLSGLICYAWRKKRRARAKQRDVVSPTHTISNGMVQVPHADRHAIMGAIAYGSAGATRGSISTSAQSRFSTSTAATASDEQEGGHHGIAISTSNRTVSGGRTLVGASSENEKSPSFSSSYPAAASPSLLLSPDSRTTSPSPVPEGEIEATPRSSTFLLHPHPSQPLQPLRPLQPLQSLQHSSSHSPQNPFLPPGSIIQPPPRTISASPRIAPVPPLSPLMPAGPPGLTAATRFSANPYAPYAYAWAVQSPTMTTSEEGMSPSRSSPWPYPYPSSYPYPDAYPYGWDHPPPSSEYLPGGGGGGSSRRTTFGSAYRASRGEGMMGGVPPYPSSPGMGMGMGLRMSGVGVGAEDGRSERSAPPMYTPSFE